MHIPGSPPQFSNIEEIGVGSNRAKRYSSQRQRTVPEPAPPMHLGVMEGHYYEPSKTLTWWKITQPFKASIIQSMTHFLLLTSREHQRSSINKCLLFIHLFI